VLAVSGYVKEVMLGWAWNTVLDGWTDVAA
jgi:hypothetical protein